MDWETRWKAFLDTIAPEIKELQDNVPVGAGFGQELAYSEKTTNHTSTNVTAYSIAGDAIITGLSIEVEGTDRPWDFEFYSLVRHSVAESMIGVCLIADGVAEGTIHSEESPSTTVNIACCFRKRMPPIAIGTSKTYQVASYTPTAGTVTWAAAVANKMWMSAVGR